MPAPTDLVTVALIQSYIEETKLLSYNIALKVVVYKRTVERIRQSLNIFSEPYLPSYTALRRLRLLITAEEEVSSIF